MSATDAWREKLYKLVWSKPLVHVAADFGCSDKNVAKWCAKANVPTPPRGYWAKKAVGKPVGNTPPLGPAPPRPLTPEERGRLLKERYRLQKEREALERFQAAFQAMEAKFTDLPLVCFEDDIAVMLGVPRRRLQQLVSDRTLPIKQLPFLGHKRKPRFPRRGQTFEMRPCWSKIQVLTYLVEHGEYAARSLETASEIKARTICTHCPVHCAGRREHGYTHYWRNQWRSR